MAGKIVDAITRRRALWITPFAFAGLVAISSLKPLDAEANAAGDANTDLLLVDFDPSGQKLPPVHTHKLARTRAEWRRRLSAEQYYVTREQATDTPFTGTYYQIHEPGLFRCICCDSALFRSEEKFDSGTGWPSFWAPAAQENVREKHDGSFGMERVEVLCKKCDAHLGHVFDDGPQPTGLRYCMNSVSLKFVPFS